MFSSRKLDYLLDLIDHPTSENETITTLSLRGNLEDNGIIEDIKCHQGEKVKKLMKNLDKFPMLTSLKPSSVLVAMITSDSLNEKEKMQKQSLVSDLICAGIRSSTSLKEVTITDSDLDPCFYQAIFNTINLNSQSIQHLSFYGFFSDYPCFPLLQKNMNIRMDYLIQFLQQNSTITSIDLAQNPPSKALKFIEAIAKNPSSKITTIELYGIPFSHEEAKRINQFCVEKNISVDLRPLRHEDTNFSYIALDDKLNLAQKEYKIIQEIALLEMEEKIKKQLTISTMSIQELIGEYKKYGYPTLTYLTSQFSYLIKSRADFEYIKSLIPSKSFVIICEHFLTNHIPSVTGDITTWQIPELQAAINSRKILNNTITDRVPIVALQSIILPYLSGLFCPVERIKVLDTHEDKGEEPHKSKRRKL